MSAGSWPAVVYQQVAIAWQASWKGTVRPTARAVRLRACPAPKTWGVFDNDLDAPPGRVALDHLGSGRGGIGGDQGQVVADR